MYCWFFWRTILIHFIVKSTKCRNLLTLKLKRCHRVKCWNCFSWSLSFLEYNSVAKHQQNSPFTLRVCYPARAFPRLCTPLHEGASERLSHRPQQGMQTGQGPAPAPGPQWPGSHPDSSRAFGGTTHVFLRLQQNQPSLGEQKRPDVLISLKKESGRVCRERVWEHRLSSWESWTKLQTPIILLSMSRDGRRRAVSCPSWIYGDFAILPHGQRNDKQKACSADGSRSCASESWLFLPAYPWTSFLIPPYLTCFICTMG